MVTNVVKPSRSISWSRSPFSFPSHCISRTVVALSPASVNRYFSFTGIFSSKRIFIGNYLRICKTLGCPFNYHFHLFAGDTGKVSKKFIQCYPFFQVPKQTLYGHPSAFEHRFAKLNIGLNRYNICQWLHGPNLRNWHEVVWNCPCSHCMEKPPSSVEAFQNGLKERAIDRCSLPSKSEEAKQSCW